MQKGFGLIHILIGIVLFAGITGGAFYLGKQSNSVPSNNQKACTMDAKICPDGSSVGRTGPNCEFAECPVTDETTNWKIYKFQEEDINFSFKYPTNWITDNTGSAGSIERVTFFEEGQKPVHSEMNQQGNEIFVLFIHKSKCIKCYPNEPTNTYIDGKKAFRSDREIEVHLDDPYSGRTITFLLSYQNNNEYINQILSTFKFN